MGILKQQEGWVTKATILALLLTATIFLFTFFLYPQPPLIPVDFPKSPQRESSRAASAPPDCQACSNGNIPATALPNSYLPCHLYTKPGSSIHSLDIAKYFKVAVEDSELLHAAQDIATQPLPAAAKPRIAFLFILRQKIPLEPLWERFFAGAAKDAYSIYTHASWWVDTFPKSSVFHDRAIPTKPVSRFDVSLVDVVRRLIAFALLDHQKANLWFVVVSEACMPVRSFDFVYNYFLNSNTSFVEAFSPVPRFKLWKSEPQFDIQQVRKGEMWVSMHRRHAGMLVGDVMYYRKFKADCGGDCVLDEMYAQTFLHVLDPSGIANRSVTYADWSPPHMGSPLIHTANKTNPHLFEKIQNRTANVDGQHQDSSDDVTHAARTCVYNGVPDSPCYLFARKFSGEDVDVAALNNITKSTLGF